MRDVDVAVSVAHAGSVDPETSHSTIEMRSVLVELTMPLFHFNNVKVEGNFVRIEGKLGKYNIHLGSGVIHQEGGAQIAVLPVHSQNRGRLFLPFVDEDPKTAEILTKIIFFAEDDNIKRSKYIKSNQVTTDMAENLSINAGSKEEKYRELLPQLYALISTETDFIANLANLSAALKQTFNFFWVGFYLVKGDELVLGPFQGPIACTRIRFGRGVCGTAWKEAHTLIVPDVEQFPGHIACSSDSKSEIVVPMMREGNVIGVLDIDSDSLDSFDDIDAHYLEEICTYLR